MTYDHFRHKDIVERLDKIIELLSAPKPALGLTPTTSKGCGHIFPWNSVIPPTHCQICGAPLETSQNPNVFRTYTTNTTNTTVVSPTVSQTASPDTIPKHGEQL